jgi:hypothetical protein
MEPAEKYGKTAEEMETDTKELALGEDNSIESMNVRDSAGNIRWLGIARDAYKTSTDFFDANIRKQIEKNLSLFQSKHPLGSKYHSESFKFRTKIFRPKTRAMVRRHEAASALAYFSTADMANCKPEDPRDKAAALGAQFCKALIEYRLEHSIPWFLTIIGAYQDAMNTGVVISRQEWLYQGSDV